MRNVLWMLLFAFSVSLVSAQDSTADFDGHAWDAPYSLAVPDGWGVERFLIPINFAPEILYKGVEDIRFTPGWAKGATEEYWSYTFLWYLEGKVKMDAKTIAANLKYYYTGLVKTNGASIPAEHIVPVSTSFKKVKAQDGDTDTYEGSVTMTDYMSHKQITLNARVHLRFCPGTDRTFVFHELSPQPFAHKVWTRLDELWSTFNCKK